MSGPDDLYWEDVCGYFYACCSVSEGGGIWPSMLSFDVELDGSITSGCARELAAMLLRAADACDASTEAIFADVPALPSAEQTNERPPHNRQGEA